MSVVRCGSRDCRSVSCDCRNGASFASGSSQGDDGCARSTRHSRDDGAGISGCSRSWVEGEEEGEGEEGVVPLGSEETVEVVRSAPH